MTSMTATVLDPRDAAYEPPAAPSAPAAHDDLGLVQRMIAGDTRAFEEFADAFIPALHRFAIRRLNGDRELAREIVQATVCKAIARLSTFRGEAALLTWLCACCRSEIAGHFRRLQRAPSEVELRDEGEPTSRHLELASLDGPERAALRRESTDLVHMALDLLPTDHGRALEWKYLEKVSVKEIARRLRLRPKAAESLLTRARAGFRRQYKGLLDDLEPRGPRRASTSGPEGES